MLGYFLRSKSSKSGFTLAEVLITIGIVGLIAALVIPQLIERHQEKARASALKKAYSVLAQAHEMMIPRDDIYPYQEFVLSLGELEEEDTNQDNTGSAGEEDNTDSSDDSPEVEPEQPSGGETGDTEEVDEPDDSGNSGDSGLDLNDKKTKELIDGIFDAIKDMAENPLNFGLQIESMNTINRNFWELANIYGFRNPGPCIVDYADQSGIDLPDSIRDFLLNHLSDNTGDNGSSSGSAGSNDNGNDSGNSNSDNDNGSGSRPGGWGGLGRNLIKGHNENIRIPYKPILADTTETDSEDEAQSKFIQVKTYQLRVLKSHLNGSDYCPSYDTCSGKTITYTNLNGLAARIEAANFNNSALKTNDGMYIWLGDQNNPQRYFVDINGSKKPNKLGVDVFTFDIMPTDAIKPESNGNCTLTGTPTSGEEYRGLGCTSSALTDTDPDGNRNGYWKYYK